MGDESGLTTDSKEDEFFALAVVAKACRKSNPGSVLGLHFCSALSPRPQSKPTTAACNVEGRTVDEWLWINGWPSVIRSVLQSIKPINQKDQPCS